MKNPDLRVYAIIIALIFCVFTNAFSQSPLPADCQSSFLKTYDSDFKQEAVMKHILLRNNRQLIVIQAYSTLPDGSTEQKNLLRLLDAQGNHIKSVEFDLSYNSIRVDDQHVLLNSITPFDGEAGLTLTLVDENLNIVWSHGIKTKNDFFTGGIGLADSYRDKNGNLYIVGTNPGFGSDKGRVAIYKLDPAGNEIWSSVHEIDATTLMTANITASPAGLIVVVESLTGLSFLYDETTGDILKSYTFPRNWDGNLIERYLKYEDGKAIYASSTAASNLMVGTFDSLAKPLKFKYLNSYGIPRGVDSRDGYMMVITDTPKEVLLKLDTTLTLQFINEYNVGPDRVAMGLGIDAAGYVYTSGRLLAPVTPLMNPYLAKFGPDGALGNCPFQPSTLVLIDIPFTVGTVAFSRITRKYDRIATSTIPKPTLPLFKYADICAAVDPCNAIKITDPGTICQLNADITIHYTTSAGCTLKPVFTFDNTKIKIGTISPGSAIFQITRPGTTRLIATIKTACLTYADTIFLKIEENPLLLNLGADTTICPSDSLVLRAGEHYAQYLWHDGSAGNSFIAKSSGKYGVLVTNSCGESRFDEIIVTVRTNPRLLNISSLNTCANDTFMISAEPFFTNYKWQSAGYISPNNANIKAILSAPSLISVTATSSAGCVARDSVAISLNYARPVNLGIDATICYNDSILLNAGTGYSSYAWSDGSGNSGLTATKPGKYYVAAKDLNGCYSRDTFTLNKYNAPFLTLGRDRNICSNQPIQLNAGNFPSFTWQDGSIGQKLTVNAAGIYWAKVKDENNCTISDTINIKAVVAPPSGFLKLRDTICRFRSIDLNSLGSYQSYSWSTGSTSSKTNITKGGDYKLTVTDREGCVATEVINVVEKDCLTGIFVPNAFSPNRDGHNDGFHAIVYGPVLNFSMTVYNRYGGIVFTTSDPSKSWDGYFHGKPADTGNYVWRCTYQFEGGKKTDIKGYTLLIR